MLGEHFVSVYSIVNSSSQCDGRLQYTRTNLNTRDHKSVRYGSWCCVVCVILLPEWIQRFNSDRHTHFPCGNAATASLPPATASYCFQTLDPAVIAPIHGAFCPVVFIAARYNIHYIQITS